MIRLAHLSDIHVTAPLAEWTRRDWFNKRMAAWVNFRLLGRGRRFRQADQVLKALVDDLDQQGVDHVVFSGDATALGFAGELRRAGEILGMADSPRFPGLAVPGNHDYCTPEAAGSGLFEKTFAAWQKGRRIDGAIYPFAQRVGPVWLVAVNSAKGNRLAWDASGRVGPDQLARLKRLLAELEPGPRILVTHYPICVASGRPEPHARCLRDVRDLIEVAVEGGICLWLHGHRHNQFFFEKTNFAPFPVVCIGSATQTGLWSYGRYLVDDQQLTAEIRAFDPMSRAFQAGKHFTVSLGHAETAISGKPQR